MLATVGGLTLAFVGIQPPNEKVLYIIVALLVVLAVFWHVVGVKKSFKGPPTGERIGRHQAHIREIEREMES